MTKFCIKCGKELNEGAIRCIHCGSSQDYDDKNSQNSDILPIQGEIRNPFLAIVLSFFCVGWGQWYNGKTWDGLKFFGVFLGSYVLTIIFSTIIVSNQSLSAILILILFVIVIGIWIYGMYDAYKTADRINKGKEIFSRKSRLFWLPIALLILVIFGAFISGYVSCPSDQFRGIDGSCYPNDSILCNCTDHLYCENGTECVNDQWVRKCPSGYFRGITGRCFENGAVLCNCGGTPYCEAGGECVNNQWVTKCSVGEFRGITGRCVENGAVLCNCGGTPYCEAGGECINNRWVVKCPTGYFRGTDGSCYPIGSVKCNCEGYLYCEAGGKCINNRWVGI